MKTLYFDIDGTVLDERNNPKPLLARGAFERGVRAAGFERLVCAGNVIQIIRALDPCDGLQMVWRSGIDRTGLNRVGSWRKGRNRMPATDRSSPSVVIDTTLVRRLVAAQFPRWVDRTVMPVVPGGWDHRTFRLGDDLAVRLPSADRYAGQVEKESRWLPVLAPLLPLSAPVPVALGNPGAGYPWPWSVYRWLDGEDATVAPLDDRKAFAAALAGFLAALQRIEPADGPRPGRHNFFRGGPVATYDEETRNAVSALSGRIDAGAVTRVWEAALDAPGPGPDVWIHGDVSAGNLLVRDGRLSAVIDFGSCAVGDPACDLAIAWTYFSRESRAVFRAALPLDDATWARGRGWALWKALISLAEHIDSDPTRAGAARRTIEEARLDHERAV